MNKTVRLTIYDFDKTVYHKDSLIRFWLFMLFRRPWLAVFLPYQIFLLIPLVLRLISMDKYKEMFLVCFRGIRTEKLASLVDQFWEKRKEGFHHWALSRIKTEISEGLTPICISASPRFLLEKITAEIGFTALLCTETDSKNGRFVNRFTGKNCKGEEKVRCLNQWAQEQKIGYKIEYFYSDSLTDLPLFRMAINSFLVKKGKPSRFTP